MHAYFTHFQPFYLLIQIQKAIILSCHLGDLCRKTLGFSVALDSNILQLLMRLLIMAGLSCVGCFGESQIVDNACVGQCNDSCLRHSVGTYDYMCVLYMYV